MASPDKPEASTGALLEPSPAGVLPALEERRGRGPPAAATHVVVGIQDSGDVLGQVPVQDRLDVAAHVD